MKKALLSLAYLLFIFTSTSFAQDGMRVGSNTAPAEMLHVEGAILVGNTTNTNLGTIRWNGTEFQGYTASGWVSLSASSYTHPTQTAIDVNATDNGINVIDRIVVNTLGHVTAVTARDLSEATTSAAGVMSAADKDKLDNIDANATANAGTVTSVSVTTANGVSGTVATPTTTPAISLLLEAITPTSVAATGTVTGSNLSGTNTGDQTIELTSDVTGSGTGSFATTIANNAVTNPKLADMTASTIKGRIIASTGDPQDLTPAEVKTMLGLTQAATGEGTPNKVAFWTGTNTYSSPKEYAATENGLFNNDTFIYDAEKDRYTCPAGKPLTTNGKHYKKENHHVKHYKAGTKTCRVCPLKEKRTTNKNGKIIERNCHQEILDANRARVEAAPQYYRQRQQITEHQFGTLKRQWGFTYTLMKRKANVLAEVELNMLNYNLIRTLSILGPDELRKRISVLLCSLFGIIKALLDLYKPFLSLIDRSSAPFRNSYSQNLVIS